MLNIYLCESKLEFRISRFKVKNKFSSFEFHIVQLTKQRNNFLLQYERIFEHLSVQVERTTKEGSFFSKYETIKAP